MRALGTAWVVSAKLIDAIFAQSDKIPVIPINSHDARSKRSCLVVVERGVCHDDELVSRYGPPRSCTIQPHYS